MRNLRLAEIIVLIALFLACGKSGGEESYKKLPPRRAEVLGETIKFWDLVAGQMWTFAAHGSIDETRTRYIDYHTKTIQAGTTPCRLAPHRVYIPRRLAYISQLAWLFLRQNRQGRRPKGWVGHPARGMGAPPSVDFAYTIAYL